MEQAMRGDKDRFIIMRVQSPLVMSRDEMNDEVAKKERIFMIHDSGR